jgi:general secretion pathway protein I
MIMRQRVARGFTLVEVLVALVLVGTAVAALLTALNSAANSTLFLREKSFAHWIATNRIIETRLATNPPADGVSVGEVEFGGQRWQWRQTIARAGFPGVRRVDVSVRPMTMAAAAAASAEAEGGDWTITVAGILGSSVALANGAEPDWEPVPANAPGSGTGGAQGGAGTPSPSPAPTPGSAT